MVKRHEDIQLNLKPFDIKRINSNSVVVVVGSRGSGKSLKKDTQILMYDGKIKLAGDIKVGDQVMGDDSTVRTVLNTHSGVDTMYEVKNETGVSYTVNSRHTLCLVYNKSKSINKCDKGYRISWFDDKAIKVRTKVFKNDFDCISFYDSIKEQLYIDIDILDYLKLPKKIRYNLCGYQVAVEFQNKPLITIYANPYYIGHLASRQDYEDAKGRFQNFDIFSEEILPNDIKTNSSEIRLQLLAGIIDGNVDKKRHAFSYEIKIHSHKFKNELVFLCNSLGILCLEQNPGIFTIKGDISKIPIKTLPRIKYTRESGLIQKITITKLKEDTYYGFELDNNKRFVLGNCIVTHNSILLKDILYTHRKIPIGLVMSHTDRLSHFYDKFIPKMLIKKEFDSDQLSKLFERQEKALDEGWDDPSAFLLMDDVLSDKSWARDPNINEVFFNGRHYKLLFLLGIQDPMGITPKQRDNIDYVFIFKPKSQSSRKKLYEHYGGSVKTQEIFNILIDACTEDHHCLVLDNKILTNKMEDQVFFYKAKLHEPFKICSNHLWQVNQERETQQANQHINQRKGTYTKTEVKMRRGQGSVTINKRNI